MARWKLMTAHYMNLVTSTDWEYVEVAYGKQARRRFVVPRLLDPRDPGDWNSRWGQSSGNGRVGNEDGEIIVCQPGKGQPGDYEFLGDPTPDMMPVDDEAREISESFSERWSYRPEQAEASFSQSLVDGFREAMVEAKPEPVKIEGLDQIMSIMAQTQKMMADLVASQSTIRRA